MEITYCYSFAVADAGFVGLQSMQLGKLSLRKRIQNYKYKSICNLVEEPIQMKGFEAALISVSQPLFTGMSLLLFWMMSHYHIFFKIMYF